MADLHETGSAEQASRDVQVAVDPRTGEVLELADAAADRLAALTFTLREAEAELKAMREQTEAELRRRLEASDRTRVVVGDYELEVKAARESHWDADLLEETLRELYDQGALQPAETTGLIKREVTVNRTNANRLVRRFKGAPRAALEACVEWREGKPKLTITHVPPLPGLELER